MPVIISNKAQRRAVVICTNCQDSVHVRYSSPAAANLTAVEAAIEKGWTRDPMTFTNMLMDTYGERCPACS